MATQIEAHPGSTDTKGRLAQARTAIVVDAGCDLPSTFYNQPGVIVLPIGVQADKHEYIDNHDLAVIKQFHADGLGERSASAETTPLSSEEVKKLFLEKLVLDYDSIYCLTISSKRSQVYANVMDASIEISRTGREMRRAAGMTRPLILRVIDTQNMFPGQGICALALMDMIDKDMRKAEVMPALYKVIESTWTYFVPDDLYFLRTRAKKKGDNSVGLFSAFMGTALDIKPIVRGYMGVSEPVAKGRGREETLRKLFRFVRKRIDQGLLLPHLNVSYGGELSELRALPEYHILKEYCTSQNITLHESMMCITGLVNVGPRGVAVAFAAPPHNLTGF